MDKDFTHNLTSYHAKYFAYELTRKSPSNELGKLSTTPLKKSVLEEILGSSGWMQVSLLPINSFETEEYLLLAGTTDQGISLDPALCQRFFSVNASENNTCYFTPDVSEQLKHLLELQKLTNIDAN